MPGVPDPLYVRARSALLDAAEALGPYLDATVLVGAQAVYLWTGDADLMVAEYMTDVDFAFDPAALPDTPQLEDTLTSRGFTLHRVPGAWLSPDGIPVDLMVPEELVGPGSRAARLGAHGVRVARRARGLEGALVDRDERRIGALDPRRLLYGRHVRRRAAGAEIDEDVLAAMTTLAQNLYQGI